MIEWHIKIGFASKSAHLNKYLNSHLNDL